MENTDIYLAYLRWYITDAEKRIPRKINDFCDHYGITLSDIRGFEDRPTYYDDMLREIRNYGVSQLPGVVHKAIEQAKTGKANSIRALKELLEPPKKENNNTFVFAINPNPTQYSKIVEREQRRIGAIPIVQPQDGSYEE